MAELHSSEEEHEQMSAKITTAKKLVVRFFKMPHLNKSLGPCCTLQCVHSKV